MSEGIRDWEYGVEGEYAFLRCLQCGLVQLEPFPDREALRRAYDIEYHGYAGGDDRGGLFALLHRLRAELFRRRMSPLVAPGARVLDVGCGAGDFLQDMRRLGAGELEGIDFSAEMVERLAAMDMRGFCGTFDEFPGQPGSYDLVAMNNYLEHTTDPAAELGRAYELLRPGGVLVGEVPGFDSWERRLFGRYWGGNHVPRHTYQFSQSVLSRMLSEAGFGEVSITHQVNTSHLALSVQNFLQRRRPDLRNNPALRRGRARYYVALLLLFLPLNIPAVLFRKSGCTQFSARRPLT